MNDTACTSTEIHMYKPTTEFEMKNVQLHPSGDCNRELPLIQMALDSLSTFIFPQRIQEAINCAMLLILQWYCCHYTSLPALHGL